MSFKNVFFFSKFFRDTFLTRDTHLGTCMEEFILAQFPSKNRHTWAVLHLNHKLNGPLT